MKLWHDDIRKPPDDTWTWARTNIDALRLCMDHEVIEASLDHDMGLHDVNPDMPDAEDFFIGPWSEEDGVSLVKDLISWGCVPSIITIHSHNPPGARRMAALLKDVGIIANIRPYRY